MFLKWSPKWQLHIGWEELGPQLTQAPSHSSHFPRMGFQNLLPHHGGSPGHSGPPSCLPRDPYCSHPHPGCLWHCTSNRWLTWVTKIPEHNGTKAAIVLWVFIYLVGTIDPWEWRHLAQVSSGTPVWWCTEETNQRWPGAWQPGCLWHVHMPTGCLCTEGREVRNSNGKILLSVQRPQSKQRALSLVPL